MESSDPSVQFLESTRFWVQRVLVPIFVLVGVAGNGVTIMVLTRRRMRCSTNVYLTALAVADLIYLLFVLVLSFQHYPNIHDKKYELYWRFYGITHWLCDAASSTSVWLTVSFTVERYIAVCHPIRGKVLCTENRAKSIITLVGILCLITTASTTFEYQLTLKEFCVKECDLNEFLRGDGGAAIGEKTDVVARGGALHQKVAPAVEESDAPVATLKMQEDDEEVLERPPCIVDDDIAPFNFTDDPLLVSQANGTAVDNVTSFCCEKTHSIDTEYTKLGKNEVYKTIMYWFSSLFFGWFPLTLIAIFNCFLVHAVYRSQRMRRRMTNNSAAQENKNISNENRITLLLIGVVIVFLICQTPTATFLIYDEISQIPDQYTRNIKRGLGNIFNFLLTLNASCNFLLYCVLSGKYRNTFRTLFCERRTNRQDTLAMSLTGRHCSQRFDPRKNGFKRNASEYCRTPRNLETQSMGSIPRSKSLMARTPGKAKSTDLNI